MRNWFVAVLPLLLIVALPPFAASGSLVPGTQAISGPMQGPHTVTVYVNRLELGPGAVPSPQIRFFGTRGRGGSRVRRA